MQEFDSWDGIRTASVIGIAKTFAGEFPHMCTIWKIKGKDEKEYVCGASLIKPNLVLTTAHNIK